MGKSFCGCAWREARKPDCSLSLLGFPPAFRDGDAGGGGCDQGRGREHLVHHELGRAEHRDQRANTATSLVETPTRSEEGLISSGNKDGFELGCHLVLAFLFSHGRQSGRD